MLDKSNLDLASKSYLDEDYDLAVKLYTDLAKDSSDNPYLLINLANAHYQSKSYGKAIKNYIKAKKTLPRNKELNNNLSLVLNEIKLKQANILGYSGLNLFESLILVLVFNILFIIRNKINMNKLSRFIVSAIFIISLVNIAFVGHEQIKKQHAVITTINATAYSGDNEAYNEIFELLDGQIIEVVRTNDKWSQVKYSGTLGWIKNESYEVI